MLKRLSLALPLMALLAASNVSAKNLQQVIEDDDYLNGYMEESVTMINEEVKPSNKKLKKVNVRHPKDDRHIRFPSIVITTDYYDDDYHDRHHDRYRDTYRTRYLKEAQRYSFCRSITSTVSDDDDKYYSQEACHDELSYLERGYVEDRSSPQAYHSRPRREQEAVFLFNYNDEYPFCSSVGRHISDGKKYDRFIQRCENKIRSLPYYFE